MKSILSTKNQSADTAPQPEMRRIGVSPEIWWGLVLAGAVLLIFGRGLWFPADIMDDVLYIGLNEKLDFTWANFVYWWHTPILELKTPLQMYSYMLDHLIWGNEHFVFGAHLHNLLLHLAAVIALFGICRESGLKTHFAGVATLIFAIHPQRIESVVWLSERKDVLALALVLAALWLFLFNLRTGKRWWAQTAPPLLFAASLLVKPMAILFPFIILAFLWRERRGWDWRFFLRHGWAFFAVMLIFLAMRLEMATGFTEGAASVQGGWNTRLAILCNNFGNYFFKTFYPYSLYPVYPNYNPYLNTLWPAILFFVFWGGSAILCWRYRNYALLWFGLLPLAVCFGAALAPVAGVVQIGNTDFADRYSYFASAFLWIAAGLALQWLWQRLPKYRRLMAGAGGVYILIIVIYSWNYLACWENARTHLAASLDHPAPNHRIVYIAAIQAYYERDFEQMHWIMDNLLKDYPHLTPERREAFESFRLCMNGMELFARNRPDEGIARLESVILTPRVAAVRYFSLSFPGEIMTTAVTYYLQHNRPDLAATVFHNMAVIYQYYNPSDYHFFMGMSFLLKNDLSNAEQSFLQALETKPDDEKIRANLEAVRRKMNETAR